MRRKAGGLAAGHRRGVERLAAGGCGGKFTADQIALILAVACEPPDKSGRPVTHWTSRELADEVIKRGIVATISVRQVGRFLKQRNFSRTKVATG